MRKPPRWQVAWLTLAPILVAAAGAEPIAYEECQQSLAFEISLVDLASRETVARAQAVGDGLLELRFVAGNAERPGEGFAFLFQPIEGRAKPGSRVHVGVELEVGR